jgi:hypothetical protein
MLERFPAALPVVFPGGDDADADADAGAGEHGTPPPIPSRAMPERREWSPGPSLASALAH